MNDSFLFSNEEEKKAVVDDCIRIRSEPSYSVLTGTQVEQSEEWFNKNVSEKMQNYRQEIFEKAKRYDHK